MPSTSIAEGHALRPAEPDSSPSPVPSERWWVHSQWIPEMTAVLVEPREGNGGRSCAFGPGVAGSFLRIAPAPIFKRPQRAADFLGSGGRGAGDAALLGYRDQVLQIVQVQARGVRSPLCDAER